MLVLRLQHVSSRFSGFLLPSPCICGKLQNRSFSKVSKQVCDFAWQANILTCLQKCRKSFCLTGAILLQAFQKMSCIFSGRRSTLETSIVILRDRRSTSDVSCCMFCESQCQGCVKWCQRANSVTGVGHGESVILCGKCSI